MSTNDRHSFQIVKIWVWTLYINNYQSQTILSITAMVISLVILSKSSTLAVLETNEYCLFTRKPLNNSLSQESCVYFIFLEGLKSDFKLICIFSDGRMQIKCTTSSWGLATFWCVLWIRNYHQISNTSHSKSQNINVSHQPDVEARMKM